MEPKQESEKKSMLLIEQRDGLFLEEPHAEWVWLGKQGMILLDKNYTEMVEVALYLCDSRFTYGVVRLHEPFKINFKEFKERQNIHLVSDADAEKWWPKKKDFWIYSFDWIKKFEKMERVNISNSPTSNALKNIEFLMDREFELIRNVKQYNPISLDNESLLKDWEIIRGWINSKLNGEEIPHSNETVMNLAKMVAEELINRGIEFDKKILDLPKEDIPEIPEKEKVEIFGEGIEKNDFNAFPDRMIQAFNMIKNDGKWYDWILQHHWSGKMGHSDIRFDVGEHLEGFTLFTPASISHPDLLTSNPQNLRCGIKEPQQKAWMMFEGFHEEAENRDIFQIVGKGTYRVVNSSESKLILRMRSDKGKINNKIMKEAELSNIPIQFALRREDNYKNLNGVFSFRITKIKDKNILLFDKLKSDKREPLNDAQIKMIFKMSKEGSSRGDIAKNVGVCKHTVWKYQKCLGFL